LGFDLFVAELDGAGVAGGFAGARVERSGRELVLFVTAAWFGGADAFRGRCCVVALLGFVARHAGERGD